MADDVEALLDHYRIGAFVGVGLSVGGLIMQRMALRRPDAMTHLVLSDTAAKIGSPEIWDPRIATVLSDGIAAIGDAILSRWFAPAYRDCDDFAMWRAMLERTPAKGYAQVCAAIRDADYRDDLAKISQPTLVLVGAQDTSTPPELVKQRRTVSQTRPSRKSIRRAIFLCGAARGLYRAPARAYRGLTPLRSTEKGRLARAAFCMCKCCGLSLPSPRHRQRASVRSQTRPRARRRTRPHSRHPRPYRAA